jgi:hypothetical protein
MNWKNIVKTVAPVLGTALGGPMAGAATKFIADKFLGEPNASDEQISQAMLTASPEQLLKLKQLDTDFALQMRQLDVDIYQIDANDRDSARKREMSIKDSTPAILAFGLAIGFFAITWKLLSDGIVSEADQIILTTISNLFMFALTYYFGSSNKDSVNKKG